MLVVAAARTAIEAAFTPDRLHVPTCTEASPGALPYPADPISTCWSRWPASPLTPTGPPPVTWKPNLIPGFPRSTGPGSCLQRGDAAQRPRALRPRLVRRVLVHAPDGRGPGGAASAVPAHVAPGQRNQRRDLLPGPTGSATHRRLPVSGRSAGVPAWRLVRTGFTLVMPRFGGWTSDLDQSAAVFGHYYPARADQMKMAASACRTPTGDRAVLAVLISDLGPWLAAEYVSEHGGRRRGREATDGPGTVGPAPGRAGILPCVTGLDA